MGVIGLAAVWAGLEVLRGYLGLPWVSGWLSLGYALDGNSATAQIASVIGVHGISALVVLTSGCLAATLIDIRPVRQISYAAIAACVPLLLAAWGQGPLPEPGPAGDARAAVFTGITPAQVKGLVASFAKYPAELTILPQSSPRDRRDEKESALTYENAALDPKSTTEVRRDGKLLALYRSPSEQTNSDVETNSVYRAADGSFGLGIDFEHLNTASARSQCRHAAELLVSNVATGDSWGKKGLAQLVNMHRFRAVETRRRVIYACASGAFGLDSRGQTRWALFPGVTSGGVDAIRYLDPRSAYTRFGWIVEPILAALTVAALLWGILGLGTGAGRAMQESPTATDPGDPQAGPPADP